MPSRMKPQKRKLNSPIRLTDDMDKLYRSISDEEARSIGQVIDATLRFAASNFSKDTWYKVVKEHLKAD